MTHIDQRILIEIFLKGISNQEYFGGNYCRCSLLKNLFRLIRLLFYSLLERKNINTISSSTILFVTSPLHTKILNGKLGQKIVIDYKRRNWNAPLITQNTSTNSIIHHALSIPKEILESRAMYEWLVFLMIVDIIRSPLVKEVVVAGHYDRFVTWSSYLSRDLGLSFTISQHGICGGYALPFKIPVDTVECFSKAEAEIFKFFLLTPQKTKFVIKGFKSSVMLTSGFFRRKTIAVASQPGYENTILEIVSIILRKCYDYDVIIYNHPADSFRLLNNIKVGDKLIPIYKQKHYNIDFLIVINSTLAYDYMTNMSFKGSILCYFKPNENCDLALYHEESITLIKPDEFEKFIVQKTSNCIL